MAANVEKIVAIALLSTLFCGFASSHPFANINSQSDDSVNQLGRINARVKLGPSSDLVKGSNLDNFRQDNAMEQSGHNIIEETFLKMRPTIDLVVEKCKKAGKNDIANNLQSKANQTFDCVKGKINMTQLMVEFESGARSQIFTQLYRSICNIWPSVHDCLNPIIDDARYCIDKAEEIQLNQNLGLIEDSNTFWCENNQKRLMDFTRDGGLKCVARANRRLSFCVHQIKERQNGGKNDNLKEVLVSDQDCNDIRTFRTCVVDQMHCSNSSPETIMDDYFAIAQKVTCNESLTTRQH